ncbi:MAG: hydrogenase 4 subunit B [Candidatus Scalindua sp.]|nr:hydrogenase 4 subunit B [Candidatus Scalindua sp.]
MISFFYLGIILFLAGAIASLIFNQRAKGFAYILTSTGAICFAIFGVLLLSSPPVNILSISTTPILEFVFRGDTISGFFILVISVVTFSVSIYSVGYTKGMANKGILGFLLSIFIISMYAVVLSGNIITFLISWETMSIVSYFLVVFDTQEKSAKAGFIYGLMTHVGVVFIIVLFLILYKYTGHMDFAGIKAAAGNLPDAVKTIIFIFAIIGFGTKAGIVPLHTWLPEAHPAAPSNISSLMSGVMIKVGIYGILRIVVDILGVGPEWWGTAIIIIGAVTSVLGIMYATVERDIKRLLAYCSVENIGIILLGIGASMILASNGLYKLSAIAMTAGLYHTLNHAVYKGLLFLGTGSLVHATHTKNLEEMGGLIKLMPYTAFFFLIGSVSICALPFFNGFVSEWLTYQSLLSNFQAMSATAKVAAPLGGAALAFSGALAVACFVKAFGIPFLGLPRSHHATGAKESSLPMLVGMAILALLCLVLGIFPGHTIKLFSPAVSSLAGIEYVFPSGKGVIHLSKTAADLSPLAILVAMIAIFMAAVVLIRIIGGKSKTSYRDSWDCGISSLTPRMQYTATAHTNPFRRIFEKVYLPIRNVNSIYILKPLFLKSISYTNEIVPSFDKYLYNPITDFIYSISRKVKLLQSGSIHLYLGYILITLLLLLLFWF